jgi:hypothetical protein
MCIVRQVEVEYHGGILGSLPKLVRASFHLRGEGLLALFGLIYVKQTFWIILL